MIPETRDNISSIVSVEISNKVNNVCKNIFKNANDEVNYQLSSIRFSISDPLILRYIDEQRAKINTVCNELINNPINGIYEAKKQLKKDQESIENMKSNMTRYSNTIEERQQTLSILDEQLRNVARDLNNRGVLMYKQQEENQLLLARCKEALQERERVLQEREQLLQERILQSQFLDTDSQENSCKNKKRRI